VQPGEPLEQALASRRQLDEGRAPIRFIDARRRNARILAAGNERNGAVMLGLQIARQARRRLL
jgi:hypothetical protein